MQSINDNYYLFNSNMGLSLFKEYNHSPITQQTHLVAIANLNQHVFQLNVLPISQCYTLNHNNNEGLSLLPIEGIFSSGIHSTNRKVIMEYDGRKFKGELINGKILGELVRDKKDSYDFVYKGEVNREIAPHGNGCIWFLNGRIYEGEFQKGKCHGSGKEKWENFESSGCWQRGSLIEGTISRKEGTSHDFVYRGEIKKRKGHGFGQLIKFKETFTGYFSEFKYHGYGKLQRENNTIYGKWDHGILMSGVCTYKCNNETLSYTGSFKNNLFCGEGLLTAKGMEYKGHFKNSEFHGYGELKIQSRILKGTWINNDLPVGIACEMGKNHRTLYTYEGELKNLNYHGRGKLFYPNELRYEGQFLDGQFHGPGVWHINEQHKCEVEYEFHELIKCAWFYKGEKSVLPDNYELLFPAYFLKPVTKTIPF